MTKIYNPSSNEETLEVLYKIIMAAHRFNKGKPRVTSCPRIYGETISGLRTQILANSRLDPLEERVRAKKDGLYKTCHLFFYGNRMPGCRHCLTFNPNDWYIDEFKQCLKGEMDLEKIHNKNEWLLHDGKFYQRTKFFLYKGNIYDTETYEVNMNGELVNKRKNFNYVFRWNGIDWNSSMRLEDDTEFASQDDYSAKRDNEVYLVEVRNCPRFANRMFFTSMFVTSGNKRLNGRNVFYLSEDEFKTLEFKPSQAHVAALEKMAQYAHITKEILVKSFFDESIWAIYIGPAFGRASTIGRRLLKMLFNADFFVNISTKKLIESVGYINKMNYDRKEIKPYAEHVGYQCFLDTSPTENVRIADNVLEPVSGQENSNETNGGETNELQRI